ncbi:hypothetical protein KAR91_43855 [Candidatus Pacearchaeota archaeon]|nr:hypothetical protein [Candidatus Pacearchaeota archaeon]
MGQSLAIPRVIPNDWKRLDLIVNKFKMRLGRDASPTHAGLTLTATGSGDQLTLSKICTVAAGLNVLRVTGLQTDGVAMTGTLRGAYIDVSNGSTAATGTIRAMELKARTEAPGDTGNDVAVLEGLSISADSKGHSVITMRAAEFILDGSAGGTIDEAVGLRIANNLQVDKATTSYGLQIYRDSFDYTADIQLSDGGVINKSGLTGLGIATPQTPLHIYSGDVATGQLRLEKSTAGGDYCEFKASNDGDLEWITTGYFMSWDDSYSGLTKQFRIWNESTAANSGAQVQIYTQGDAAGDPLFRFKINPAGGQWCLGIDNSDSDKFKISASNVPETNTAITIDLSLTIDIGGKLTAGAWGSPIDVTTTRKYGIEFHYSGNDYDVFGIRSRANLITTANSSTRTATGAELQAANSNGISVNVLCGAKCSSTGKSTSSSATISYMRAVDLITEWGAKDTVTNLYNTYIKCITRNVAGEGSFGTGYGVYLENIAVGGTGQTLDAGIRFQETDLAEVEGFTYGIDFRGGTYTTAEMVCSSGTSINGSIITVASTDTSDPKLCLKTTNTAHEVCFQLDENVSDDHVDFKGETALKNTRFHVIAQTGYVAYMGVQQGSYRGELICGSAGHISLLNTYTNVNLILGINQGGTPRTITWDGTNDKLKHSVGTFNFDDDHLTTTGNLTAAGLTITNACVFGSNSVVFQPNTDSTTFFQVLDADGGTPILNVDTTNERVGIGTTEGFTNNALTLQSEGGVFDCIRESPGQDIILTLIRLRTRTTGTPAAGIGAAFSMRVENSAGEDANIGYFTGSLTNVTNGSEIGEISLAPDWHDSRLISLNRQFKVTAVAVDEIKAEMTKGDFEITDGELIVRLGAGSNISRFVTGAIDYGRIIVNGSVGCDTQIAFQNESSTKWSMGNDADTDALSIRIGPGAFGTNDVFIMTATTDTELLGTTPYLTLHNITHEDSDGGRESRLNFKGEQGVTPFEETTLARIEASHDGAGADDKGKVVISTNNGTDGDTPTDHVAVDAAGNTKIGDAGTANYANISATGDTVFVGTAGLAFGCLEGIDETVTCTVEDTWYQVTFDTAGPVNLIEADTVNNELEVDYEGIYQVGVTACFHSNPSNDFELMVKKTDGTVDLAPHLFQTTAVADKVENAAGYCLIDINASDRVELWVRCTSAAGQDAVFDHVSLTLTQIGGT